MQLIKAKEEKHFNKAKKLISQYFDVYKEDLGSQEFDRELEVLQEMYEKCRHSEMILAMKEGKAMGCIGLKKMPCGNGEVKRFFVKPEYRKLGVGKQLMQKLINVAKNKNYKSLYLDALGDSKPAVKLYNSLGFEETKPYYDSPLKNPVFMSLNLEQA